MQRRNPNTIILVALLAMPLAGCQVGELSLFDGLTERFGSAASETEAEAASESAAQPNAAPEAAAAAEGDPIDPRCVRWKPSSGGEFILTNDFASGADGAPFEWIASESGILDICAHTLVVALACTAGDEPIQLDIIGDSLTNTTLSGGGVGKVLTIDGCTGTFKNFTVVDGNDEGRGGAASVAPGAGNEFKILEVVFDGNQNATAGGALATGAGSVLVQSVDFTGNTAPEGGAITSSGTALKLVDVEFHDNVASTGDGGALNHTGGSLNGTDILAAGNSAAGAGGAFISSGAAVELQNVTFDSNEAEGTDGGGLYLDGGTAFLLDIRGYGNTATVEGGAVFFNGTATRVQNSTFEDNTAGEHGGAFGLAQGATVSNLDARWHRNNSGDWGGAIHGDSSCVFSGQNSDFGGNHPDEIYWQTYTYSGWGLNMHFSCEGNDCDPCSEWRFYKDTDGDGWGDEDDWMEGCGPAIGYVADPGDCDESDPTLHPGVVEICDGIDNDCDSNVDEDTVEWHDDADADGFGDSPVVDCLPAADAAPAGAVEDDTDCNDSDASTNPAAIETCDSLDNDCDASIDEGLTCP